MSAFGANVTGSFWRGPDLAAHFLERLGLADRTGGRSPGEWLRSLAALKTRLPEDLFVLPSHGEPFYGVTTRLEALIRGHETALKRLERTLKAPCRAVDVFSALFARPVGDEVLSMATGEAIAHLNYLAREGGPGATAMRRASIGGH